MSEHDENSDPDDNTGPDEHTEPDENEPLGEEAASADELEGLSVEERLVVRKEELAEHREELADRDEELAQRDEADAEAELYRRRVAILLAAVAVLGAWIAVLQANAGTNESSTARDTTRTAVEAQSSAVVVEGLKAMREGAVAEVETLPLRTTFTQSLADFLPDEELPFDDQDRIRLGLGIASENALGLTEGDPELLFDFAVEQREKALTRDALTEERITWNARASQYETVITVLGVALFLIGFTLVLARKIRPPILIPGLILVIYCFGWTVWIYNKPIPAVSAEAITATAEGDVYLTLGEVEPAIESLTTAIEADEDYLPPHAQRSIANMTLANPDILETFAIVDNSSEVFEAAVEDARRALDLGGEEDITTLAITAVITLAANEYGYAEQAIDTAIGLNENSPGLHLFASVVDLANGDVDAARVDLEAGLSLVQPSEPSGRIRSLAADYYSWLGWVESQNPDLVEEAAALRDQMAASEAFLTDGDVQSGDAPASAGIVLNGVDFVDDTATVDVELEGVTDDDYVVVLIFERPSEGGPWVQGAQMAYLGPAVVLVSQGSPIELTRACEPVEFRADLYVEGVFIGSDSAPGVAATC